MKRIDEKANYYYNLINLKLKKEKITITTRNRIYTSGNNPESSEEHSGSANYLAMLQFNMPVLGVSISGSTTPAGFDCSV